MTKIKICFIVILLILLFLIIFSINFYFLNRLNNEINLKKELYVNNDIVVTFNEHINKKVSKLKPVYVNRNPRYYPLRGKLIKNFTPNGNYDNVTDVWHIANLWPNNNEVYPSFDVVMGNLLHAMVNTKIVKAQNSQRGTQMKLIFHLQGKQFVIFKPQWYSRDRLIQGMIYSGKDRHNSEIISFYLGAVLNLRWTPIAVGTRINLKELYYLADDDLKSVMNVKPNETQFCVYGKCFYCKETESVCGNKLNHMIEGVVLYFIPGAINKHRSPWQRTYKENEKASWEVDSDYCSQVKSKLTMMRLLDLVDAAVFDFLIQNGDRHHYETRNNRLLLLDNGKGFGNPYTDSIDILAPLYQCCVIRRSTWEKLLIYSGGNLSEILHLLSKNDPVYPLLNDKHLEAIDRRLLFIYATVENCKEEYGNDVFK